MNTVAEIKSNWIKIESNITSLDTQIQGWIDIAVDHITKLCRQPVLQKSVQITFVGNGRQIKLAHVMVPLAVTASSYRALPSDAWTTISPNDITAFDVEGVQYLFRDDTFSTDYFYKVTANVGYAIADVPKLVKTVCGEMVYVLFRESPYSQDQRTLGVDSTSKTQGGVTTSQSFADMIPRWAHMLEPYTVVTA